MQPDYDHDPERFRTGQRVTARYAHADLYAEIAGVCAATTPSAISDAARVRWGRLDRA